MKYIVAIIQPHKLEEVKQALEAVEVNLMTVSNVLGQGRQKGYTEIYRGAKEVGGLLRKVRLDRGTDHRRNQQGGPDRRGRGREDLRAGAGRLHPDQLRRTGRKGDRLKPQRIIPCITGIDL
jgi:hypothetical protein